MSSGERLREAEEILRECDSSDGFCGEMPDDLRERIQIFLGSLAACPVCEVLTGVLEDGRFGRHLDARAGAESGAPVECPRSLTRRPARSFEEVTS